MRRAVLNTAARALSTALLGTFSTSFCMPPPKAVGDVGSTPPTAGGSSILARNTIVAAQAPSASGAPGAMGQMYSVWTAGAGGAPHSR